MITPAITINSYTALDVRDATMNAQTFCDFLVELVESPIAL
jgi:hypothetical protein